MDTSFSTKNDFGVGLSNSAAASPVISIGFSHLFAASPVKITGIRSRNGLMSSFVSVVTMVHLNRNTSRKSCKSASERRNVSAWALSPYNNLIYSIIEI